MPTLTSQRLVAISTLFSAWGDRMWNFAIGLYLIELTPGSFQLSAVYGLVWTSVAILFTPAVGHWIDRSDRLKIIRNALIVQNLMIIIDAMVMYILFENTHENNNLVKFAYAAVILFGAIANLIGQAEKISIAKDWIVVTCNSDEALLSESNALLRRIDLVVAITAPIAVGFAMSIVSVLASIIFICAWNLLSFFPEYFILLKVYKDVPRLAIKSTLSCVSEKKKIGEEYEDNAATETHVVEATHRGVTLFSRIKEIILGWAVYWKQDVVLAGITLSMLYLTVLGFNNITTGYAYTQGLAAVHVSICFGLGSLLGISGTFLFPFLRSKFGLIKSGTIGLTIQWSMLMICVGAIWAPGSPSLLKPSNWESQSYVQVKVHVPQNNSVDRNTAPHDGGHTETDNNYTSIIMILIGIMLSRVGLWIIDLTVTQLQQDTIPEHERGTVGGIQYALNEIFDLSHFVLTILLPRPNEFGYLILVTVSSITMASVIYHIFSFRFNRKRKVAYENIDV